MLKAALRRLANTPLHPHWLYLQRTERSLIRVLLSRAHGEVLDVGCGARIHEQRFRQISAVTGYTALDYLPWEQLFERQDAEGEAALGALGRFLNPDRTVRPDVWGDAHALPVRDGCVATVALLDVLEHIPEPGAVIAEAFRVLRPGGTALIAYPFLVQLHCGVDGDADYYRFTKAAIIHLLTEAGFDEIDVAARGGVGTSVAFLLNSFTMHLIYRLLARARVFVTLLPFAAVLFAGTQLAGLVLDRLDRTGLFPTSYDVVARRPRA